MLLHIWSVRSRTVPEKSPDGLQQACNRDSHALASLVVVINLFLSFTRLLTMRYLSIAYFHLRHSLFSLTLIPQHFLAPPLNDTSFTVSKKPDQELCIFNRLLQTCHTLTAAVALITPVTPHSPLGNCTICQ